jgi:hypothetical protein
MADSSLNAGLSATSINNEKSPSLSTASAPRSSISGPEEKPIVNKTRPYSGLFSRRSTEVTGEGTKSRPYSGYFGHRKSAILDKEGSKSRPYSGYFGRRKSAIIEEEETKEVKAPEVPPVSFLALFRCVQFLLSDSAVPDTPQFFNQVRALLKFYRSNSCCRCWCRSSKPLSGSTRCFLCLADALSLSP